ncbi:MAG: ribonuclease P protein component [Polyangiaceae bacterium]|nr:ribonuclease P protein component [Polyangiaceae bacterium]
MDRARPEGRYRKSARVRKRAEYLLVQQDGRRVTTRHFVLLCYARPISDPARPRLGITASRKVGIAIVRNRAKRLVRESFRSTSGLWSPGLDLVVIVRRALTDMKLDDVTAELLAHRRIIEKKSQQAFDDLRVRQSPTPA